MTGPSMLAFEMEDLPIDIDEKKILINHIKKHF